MDVQDELRQLEKRRQAYLSTVQDPSTTRVEREEALGDLQLTEAKIAELGKLSRLSGKWLSADFQFPEIPFYKRGCQEKHFRADWRASRHPALRCNEAL